MTRSPTWNDDRLSKISASARCDHADESEDDMSWKVRFCCESDISNRSLFRDPNIRPVMDFDFKYSKRRVLSENSLCRWCPSPTSDREENKIF
jgi:hypothetical protein